MILIIFLVFFGAGCASYFDSIFREPPSKIDYGPNLEGLTKDSIRAKFGNPTSTKTSYEYHHRIDTWDYCYKFNRQMHITFLDGYVNNVWYD